MSQYFRVIILLAICIGCKNNPVENKSTKEIDPFSTLSSDSVVVSQLPIKSRVYFYLIESITETSRLVTLTFMTEQIYGSSGYAIVASLGKTSNQIDIQLDSIKAPEAGAAIGCPATVNFQLGNLPNDLYNLTIRINGQNIQALLLVSDTSFIAKVQPNNMISAYRPRLLRVPQTVIWGQAESILPTVYQQFIDSLILAGAKPATLPIGEYNYFRIVSPDSFYIPSAMGMQYGKYFIYEFDPDISVSRNLVKSFAKKYGDSVCVQLSGGRGEMYYTTVLQWEP